MIFEATCVFVWMVNAISIVGQPPGMAGEYVYTASSESEQESRRTSIEACAHGYDDLEARVLRSCWRRMHANYSVTYATVPPRVDW